MNYYLDDSPKEKFLEEKVKWLEQENEYLKRKIKNDIQDYVGNPVDEMINVDGNSETIKLYKHSYVGIEEHSEHNRFHIMAKTNKSSKLPLNYEYFVDKESLHMSNGKILIDLHNRLVENILNGTVKI